MVDTTIPSVDAQIVDEKYTPGVGSAGRIAIVGKFEKGNGNTVYYAQNANDALAEMGNSPSYEGSKIIPLIFKNDENISGSRGADSCLCVKIGASIGASVILSNVTGETTTTVLTFSLAGGVWGNSLKISVGDGTQGTTKKITIYDSDDKILQQEDNLGNTDDIIARFTVNNKYIKSIVKADTQLAITNTTTATSFNGGTETASPSATDLATTLDVLLDEDFDILVFTEELGDTAYEAIKVYLDQRFEIDKPAGAVLGIKSEGTDAKTVDEAVTLAETLNTTNIYGLIYQKFTSGIQELTEVESAARYAGLLAGLPVQTSATNKEIGDITALSTTYNTRGSGSEGYALVNAGITILQEKDRRNNTYKVISAVTPNQEINNYGRKNQEVIFARTRNYISKYFDLADLLGENRDISLVNIKATLEAKKQEILTAGVVQELSYNAEFDTTDPQLVLVDIYIKTQNIVKHISKRIKAEDG